MTDQLKAWDLIIPLPRPEYVALPEGFISSLAWKILSVDTSGWEVSGKKTGLRYMLHGPDQASKTVRFVQTIPEGENLVRFAQSLEKHGLDEIGTENLLAKAVLNSIKGSTSLKSKFVPASPLSPAIALLQNPIGFAAKANPADFAQIIETIYALGKGGTPTASASALWYSASLSRLDRDPLLKAIDAALTDTVWEAGVSKNKIEPMSLESGLCGYLENTPFEWFAEVWEQITSDDWVKALPARVWVDWATCILRTGYSMAYLWEASWYESLARELLSLETKPSDFMQSALQGMEAPIVWKSKESSAEIRNLSSKLKSRCNKSMRIRSALQAWIIDNSLRDVDLEQFVAEARQDNQLMKSLQTTLTSNPNGANQNDERLYEAIKYSLISRGKGDHYGFLENAGSRYLFASPGIEWGALMASLAAEKPGAVTNLGAVAAKIAKSGTQTQARELLELLERTGLARGSADADLALEVETAYKQGDAKR
jgi:hypothetical protein